MSDNRSFSQRVFAYALGTLIGLSIYNLLKEMGIVGFVFLITLFIIVLVIAACIWIVKLVVKGIIHLIRGSPTTPARSP